MSVGLYNWKRCVQLYGFPDLGDWEPVRIGRVGLIVVYPIQTGVDVII